MRPSRAFGCALLLALGVAPTGWSAQLGLDAVLGGTGAAGFARADRVRSFEFPADHGPHEAYRSEWWYLTLNLLDAEDRPFGVQFTAFRQALVPGPAAANPWASGQMYLAHFAVTDVARCQHRAAERLARGHPRLAGARAEPFAVWVDGWRLDDPDGGFEALRLIARDGDLAVDLALTPLKGPVLQGDRGLSAKGPEQASYYYSFSRLGVRGTVRSHGMTHRVEGRGWFDREWSTSVLSAGQVGWDWFGLHLDDGADLMAFRLRRADGVRDPYDHGAWIAADGSATALAPGRFELVPLRFWQDERGVRWPVEWRVTVDGPEGARELRVVAALEDQRMDTLLTYWEGLVRVLDPDGRPIGAGYMELTGYE